MTLKENIKEILDGQDKTAFTKKQLFDLLGVTDRASGERVIDVMEQLCADGAFIYDGKTAKYRKLDPSQYVVGVIQGHARGFGFCIDEKAVALDLFLTHAHLHGALHMDRVIVKRLPGTRDEGEVVKILSRGLTQIVGTMDKKHSAFVIPDDSRFASDIYVPSSKTRGAKNKQKVLVKITSYPAGGKNPEGEVIKIIGYPDEKGSDILSVAYKYGLDPDFPADVKKSAEAMPAAVDVSKFSGREDFTSLKVFTIDGADSKDLDDAVSVALDKNGNFVLGVHIADVSHYVRQGSVIDGEAFDRGTSVYFPDRVFPMLPVELSNGICSLNQGEARLTMSCVMTVDGRGKVIDSRICEGIIKTAHRMTYDDVTGIIDGDAALREKYADITPDILLMKQLAEILIEKRRKRGCIDFETKEVKFVLDENGKAVDILPYQRTISHKMIEEFMILANETVAECAFHAGLPFVYRVHDKPDPDKLGDLNAFLNGFGLSFHESPENIHSMTLQKVMTKAEDTPYSHIVAKVMLRSMQKARYSSVNSGHFGLASECYCHFTSPIRRYPDLVVHRMLKLMLKGELSADVAKKCEAFVKEASAHSSEREKIADEAERDVDDIKKAEYAQSIIGEEFDGIISGVTSFGIFVELPNTVEGLIRVENLPGQGYEYDEKKYTLASPSHRFTLSAGVRIRVAASDAATGRIDFDFVDMI